MHFSRFIAVGDSFTEGMSDEVVNGQYRGWADRIAEVMAAENPDFTYANFAVRGKLIPQVAAEQIPIALAYANGPETLFSFHAGANDLMRPGYKADVALQLYTDTVRAIAKTGATILLFTVLERPRRGGKMGEAYAKRFSDFNANLWAVAKEVGAFVADANEGQLLADRRFLASDRLHLNSRGHERVAQGILHMLGLPHSPDWREPLPPAKPPMRFKKLASDALWFTAYFLPWALRRLQGRSSGDGRSSKHSQPMAWQSSTGMD